MFKRVMIANRGQIAVRLIRGLRDMGIETVNVYDASDRESLSALLATEAVELSPGRAGECYLNQDAIIEKALETRCDAIHPGYGFLSGSAGFARKCEERGLNFIGPSWEALAVLEDKKARTLLANAGVPVIPVSGPALAVMHQIDVQLMADKSGNIIWFGERDCSILKEGHRLLVESPARCLSDIQREELRKASEMTVRTLGVSGPVTIAFFIDKDEKIYLKDVYPELQGEHAMAEELAGLDFVREQVRIADGSRISVSQEEISRRLAEDGHVIECRIMAESGGRIEALHLPGGFGVRVDSAVYVGYEVRPYYDRVLAHVVVQGKTRLETIRRLRRALEEMVIDGVSTNIDLMHMTTYHPEFIRGSYDVHFWEKNSDLVTDWLREGLVKDEDT